MRWVGRGLLALAAVFVVGAAVGAWWLYGRWPVPEGFTFPRHSMLGGPAALYVGELQEIVGCISTDEPHPATVVWPPGYRLVVEDGAPLVLGGSEAVPLHRAVRMGGGWYEDGNPPPTSFDIGSCPAPYFLTTGFIDD
jgi:hypothetical protein